jgi:fatty acid desaturase
MARRSLPIPPPLEGSDQLIAAVITGGWVIALIAILIAHGHLAPSDRWWTWVPVVGTGIGLFGLAFVPWLKRSRHRTADRRAARRADGGS